MRHYFYLCLAMLAAACASNGPIDPNRGLLVASDGVKAIFDDESVDVAEAVDDVRCERTMIVGSHLIRRYCYTLPEAERLEERVKEFRLKFMQNQPKPSLGSGGGGGPQ